MAVVALEVGLHLEQGGKGRGGSPWELSQRDEGAPDEARLAMTEPMLPAVEPGFGFGRGEGASEGLGAIASGAAAG